MRKYHNSPGRHPEAQRGISAIWHSAIVRRSLTLDALGLGMTSWGVTKYLSFFVLIVAFMLSVGCGFKLRGLDRASEIPAWLNPIMIVNNGSRELEPLLIHQLQSYHISVVPTNSTAKYSLIIERDSLEKQITNVSASTTPRQYLLLYTVQFSLVGKNGVVILPTNAIVINRQFTLNNDRILGSDYEEMTFKREMQRDAAMQIINRLSKAQKEQHLSPLPSP